MAAEIALQPALFHESVYDALKSAVAALGGSKTVAAALWPAKPVEDARRLLADCLNPERPEKLDPEQLVHILRLARDAGYHGAMNWIADASGYEAQPIDPETQQEHLARVIADSTETTRRALVQLEKLQKARR